MTSLTGPHKQIQVDLSPMVPLLGALPQVLIGRLISAMPLTR